MNKSELKPGQVIEVRNYPFVREVFNFFDESGPTQTEGWRPGCSCESDEQEASYVADSTGHMVLTVISTHKPGKFQERVFFTRKWSDPDGAEFGSNKLRVTSKNAFIRLSKGYRHAFYNAETGEDVAP